MPRFDRESSRYDSGIDTEWQSDLPADCDEDSYKPRRRPGTRFPSKASVLSHRSVPPILARPMNAMSYSRDDHDGGEDRGYRLGKL